MPNNYDRCGTLHFLVHSRYVPLTDKKWIINRHRLSNVPYINAKDLIVFVSVSGIVKFAWTSYQRIPVVHVWSMLHLYDLLLMS